MTTLVDLVRAHLPDEDLEEFGKISELTMDSPQEDLERAKKFLNDRGFVIIVQPERSNKPMLWRMITQHLYRNGTFLGKVEEYNERKKRHASS